MSSQSPGNQPPPAEFPLSPGAKAEGFLSDIAYRSLLACQTLYANGRPLNAIMALKHGLSHDPGEMRLRLFLILIYKQLNKFQEADVQLDFLRKLQPSGEVAQLIESHLQNWTYQPNLTGELVVSEKNHPHHFTSSTLGVDGRFGNQIFQYAFPKLYSEKYGLHFESYSWIGQSLFNLKDHSVTRVLPFILEIEYLRDDLFAFTPEELGICDRDSQGYFQLNSKYYAPFKNSFVSLFQPIAPVATILQAYLYEIRQRGKTLVVIHLRRGDSHEQGRKSSTEVYVEWLKWIWPSLESPLLYLATDDLEGTRQALAEFHPITAEHLQLPVPRTDFYPDFYIMTQADCLAIGNSTFSFGASMLNNRARLFVRPNPDNSALIPFDPWCSPPIV